MQNSNPNPHPFSVPFPFSLDDTLARAYARAREACGGAAPSASDIFAAYGAPDEPIHEPAEPRTVTERIDVGELLRVFREPIEWLLARAERRALADPVDVAAIQRVRDAVRARLTAAVTAPAAPTDRSRLRATDLLIVAGLLVGTIDPAVVQRATVQFGDCFADTISAMLPLDPSLASLVTSAVTSLGRPRAPRPVVPSWCCPYAHIAL